MAFGAAVAWISAAGGSAAVPLLPGNLVNLTGWKLTLPVDTKHNGTPDEILQPELESFLDKDHFFLNDNRTGVVFRAPCSGVTTRSSGYPRSELREMSGGGRFLASWSTFEGTHSMVITQAITRVPPVKPHVVAGQIHGPKNDVVTIRLEGTKLFIDENGDSGPVLNADYQLGDVFTVKFLARNGAVECFYNGMLVHTLRVRTDGCYFKAGCYTQSNVGKGDAPTAVGEVVIHGLVVRHE